MDFTSNFYNFTVVAVFCTCCINPIVYSVQYRQFQNRLLQVFCRKRAGNNFLSTVPTVGTVNASGVTGV